MGSIQSVPGKCLYFALFFVTSSCDPKGAFLAINGCALIKFKIERKIDKVKKYCFLMENVTLKRHNADVAQAIHIFICIWNISFAGLTF